MSLDMACFLFMNFSYRETYNDDYKINHIVFMMTILWIVLGGIVGWFTTLSMEKSEQNALLDTIFGILGALIGVWIMTLFGKNGFVFFDWWSFLAGTVGAVVLVWIVKSFR